MNVFSAPRLIAIAAALAIPSLFAAQVPKAVRASNLNNALLRLREAAQNVHPAERLQFRKDAASLIQERAAALSALIEENPAEAEKFALSPELVGDLAAMFPESAGHLETYGTWEGPVEQYVFDYPDKTSRTVHRMKIGEQRWVEVHFAGAEPSGFKSGDILQTEGLSVGGHILGAKVRVQQSALTSAAAASTTCSTTGTQNSAVLLVTFPGITPPSSVTSQGIYNLFFGGTGPSLSGYWQEASYGQASAAGNVYGWYTLSGSYSCSNVNQFLSDAMSAAAASGVDFTTHNRVFIVFPDMSPSCGWSGLSSIGCYNVSTSFGTFNVSTTTFVWNAIAPLNNITYGVVFHEAGHQLGLAHGRLRQFTDSAGNLIPLGALGATGTLSEYGDHSSTMGFPGGAIGHYAAGHKVDQLNWLSGSNYQVVQSSGTYTLQPYETSPVGLKALKIQRGTGNNAWLWVEYRQPTGIYDSTLNAQMSLGALIHYEDPSTSPQTDLLDFTAPAAYSDDPALATGQTWTDPYTNLSISVVSATSSGLTISVNYGTVPCTHANPSVSMSPANPSFTPGASVAYTVSVTNNDSTACASTNFSLSSTQPSGWSGTLSGTSLTLSPGQAASVALSEAVPYGTSPGMYTVSASAANATNTALAGSATANATVVNPTLSVTLSASGSTFKANQKVSFTAKVLTGTSAAAGANVTFTLTRANGSTINTTVNTDSTGTATWSYKFGQKDPKGTWSAGAQASFSSQSASSNIVTFAMQ